jgi:putative ABC transport system permease protein
MNGELHKNISAFENRLKSIPNISEIARSRAVPGRAQEMQSFTVNGQNCPVWYWAVDDHYINMMGFEIIQGRNFLKDSRAEEHNMICNETASKQYGWTLGTKIGNGILVGIMKDFNLVSLREKVEPFAFWYANPDSYFNVISIKLAGGDVKQTLASIEKAYNEFSPMVPFRYYFLDTQLNLLYSKENQQVKLITFFSLLSVIVSILGILGLSTFMCQYRVKEIGIRKVNGAKISEMLAMLNRDFVKWVIIAFVIAVPLSWYAMNHWLESFVYKTHVSWWIFALAGLLALGIALLTVSWQSWRAATRNPVESLRYE